MYIYIYTLYIHVYIYIFIYISILSLIYFISSVFILYTFFCTYYIHSFFLIAVSVWFKTWLLWFSRPKNWGHSPERFDSSYWKVPGTEGGSIPFKWSHGVCLKMGASRNQGFHEWGYPQIIHSMFIVNKSTLGTILANLQMNMRFTLLILVTWSKRWKVVQKIIAGHHLR